MPLVRGSLRSLYACSHLTYCTCNQARVKMFASRTRQCRVGSQMTARFKSGCEGFCSVHCKVVAARVAKKATRPALSTISSFHSINCAPIVLIYCSRPSQNHARLEERRPGQWQHRRQQDPSLDQQRHIPSGAPQFKGLSFRRFQQ